MNTYTIKSPILGFENINKITFEKIDDAFAKITDAKNDLTQFLLVNPYALREYSFDVPISVATLLDIKDDSNVNVYCIMVSNKDIYKTKVNFLAPLIFNEDNKTATQLVLSPRQYSDFDVAESLTKYLQEDVA